MVGQSVRTVRLAVTIAAVVILGGAAQARAGVLYSNGFEVDNAGWNVFAGLYATRVPSGTNGIASATGAFHAESVGGSRNASGSATNWGGYNYGAGNAVPTVFQEYTTSLKVFLDVAAPWANDTRFDYTSAINNAAGTHLRDFAFNAGFYDDASGPGGGTDRFVISASNNTGRANSYPKNPGRDPIAISTSGWYTFEHHFYNNAGVLNVDLSIFDASNSLVHSWTLGSDPISGVGGNRYGWFATNEFSVLALDDTYLRTADTSAVPEPTSLALLGMGAIGLAFRATRRRQSAK